MTLYYQQYANNKKTVRYEEFMKKMKGFSVIMVCLAFALMTMTLTFTACSNESTLPTPLRPETPTVYYTVTFNANGGSGMLPSEQTVQAGSKVYLPDGSGLSMADYTFGGWNTNEYGTGTNYSAGSSYTVRGNITLYAFWNNSTETYTVIFDANGGSGILPSEQAVQAGSSITLPDGGGLSRTGFTFGGWNTDEYGTGTNYGTGSSYTPTTNVTLYAKWNEATVRYYTVTFNANGGNGTVPVRQTVQSGSSIILPDVNGLTRAGYTFGGWNTNQSGTGNNYSADSSYTVIGTITLYAHWILVPENSFTVTFNSNGGSSVEIGIVESGGMAVRPADPTHSGYTFDNWYSDMGLTVAYDFSVPVTGNITLYAKWLPNSAGITIDVKQIVDGAPIIANITISRTDNGHPVTYSVSVTAADYDAGSIKWEIAGVGAYAGQIVTGSGASFTLNAAEVKYNSVGGHVLILTVTKDGQQYQRAIPFAIVH